MGTFNPMIGAIQAIIQYDDSVSIDTSEISINLDAGVYADEVETLNYIDGIFKNIKTVFQNCQSLLTNANNYLETNREIADGTPQPELLNFNFNVTGSAIETATDLGYITNPIGVVTTGGSNLNIRSGASADTDIKGHLTMGSAVTITKRIDDNPDDVWYEIKTEDGQTGFVSGKYITIKEQTPLANPSVPTSPDLQTGVVTTGGSNLNIRYGPSTDTKIIGTFKMGSEVKILDYDPDAEWYKIQLDDGTIGYVYSEYINV